MWPVTWDAPLATSGRSISLRPHTQQAAGPARPDRPLSILTRPNSNCYAKKGSPYSITERRVPELIPVLGSQPAGDVSHKPGGRLPLLSARPAVTPATLKRAATNFAAR